MITPIWPYVESSYPSPLQNNTFTIGHNVKAIEYYENGTIKRIEYFPLTTGSSNAA